MRVTLIVATDQGGLIGRDGGLPWRLPADLRHFKRTTMGKPLVMGRKTWESIGKPLPGRKNIVLTRRPGYEAPGCEVAATPADALAAAAPAEEVMVIGGSAVYEAFLPLAGRIHLTEVHARFEGDTWFPALDRDLWREVSREDQEPDDRNPYPYSFVCLERARHHAQEAQGRDGEDG